MKSIFLKIKYLMIVILLLFGPLVTIPFLGGELETHKAVKGVLDLSRWEFPPDATISLNGEWEFYWDQLLTPSDFVGNNGITKPQLTGYINAPGQWQGNLNEVELQKKGRATYRLVIKVPAYQNVFGIKTEIIRVTNILFVNGAPLGGSGVPLAAASLGGKTPENTPYTAYFSSNGDRVEILLQVADYVYAAGGIILPIQFGGQAAIQALVRKLSSFELSAFAFLCSGGLYHIGIFLFGRRDRSLLYFGLFCLCVSLFELTMGQKLLSQFFTGVSFEAMYDLRILLIYVGAIIMALFLQHITNGSLPSLLIKGIIGLFGGNVLAVFFLPYTVHIQGEFIFLPLVTVSYVLFILLLTRLLYQERYGNIDRMGLKLLILALWCIWLNSVVTILQTRLLIANNRIIGDVSLILFVMLMSYMLSIKYANAYAAIEKMSVQLREQDKLKDVFLSNTSHEFKTPLHGIINITQTMLEDFPSGVNQKQRESLSLVVSIARRLSVLVNDILDFEKIKNNEISLHITSVDVRSAVETAFEIYHHITKDGRIKLVNAVPNDLSLAQVDENRLRQVLYNLIGNAVKFTANGQVVVTAKVRDDMLYISVIDTGIGIPPDKHKDIFLSFEQVNAIRAGKYGGSGLGLAIAKQLVERMGGNIWVAWSEIDKGSEIVLTLPVSPQGSADYVQNTPVSKTIAGTAFLPEIELKTIKGGEFTILAVDDEPTNLKVMLNVFAKENYDVLTAASGTDALRIINENRNIDIVLLDVMMPGMTGYDLCRRLRKEYSLFDLPILLVTVHNMPEDVERGFAAGANDFVVKPFDVNELRARVATLLALKKAVADTVRAELAFLQSQIKPHFFYNVLNTIMSFCYTDSVKAGKLLAEFTNYLRRSFDIQDTAIFTSLEKELELVKSYIVIEQARFGDRLTVTYAIDPELLSWKLPPLIIQPIMENAVRHGLMSKEEGGHIRLDVRSEESNMIIEVADDGIGIAEDVLSGLLECKLGTSGIGLRNINGRLLKFYGRTLNVKSEKGRGTTVILQIPVHCS